VKSILPLVLTGAATRKRGKTLIGPVDLTVGAEGFTIVIGPNGSGKTSLLQLMHGLGRVSKGSVRWNVSQAEAQRQQAYVFQTPIMMRRRVVDCIAYPLLLTGTGRKAARARAAEWATRLGLGEALDRPATVLSGGEKQKLALARALIRKPEILFLDEPCANLDGRATREIETILLEAYRAGTRIVMATHDMGQAKRLSTEIAFLYKGMIHEYGSAETFFSAPKTHEAQAFLRGDILE